MTALKSLLQSGKLLQNNLCILNSSLHLTYHNSQCGHGLNLMIMCHIHPSLVTDKNPKQWQNASLSATKTQHTLDCWPRPGAFHQLQLHDSTLILLLDSLQQAQTKFGTLSIKKKWF